MTLYGVELVVLETPEEAAAAVADELVAAARDGLSIVLTGGKSPGRAYELAAEREPDWSRATLWWGDERCVPPDDERSNFRLAREKLLDKVAVQPREVHRIRGEAGAEAAAAEYDGELEGASLDLVLLGIGPDGHTASLFPGHALLDAGVHVAGISDSPKPPPERITLTLPTLNASHHLMLLVTGADKAEALARVLAGPDRGTPASLLERDKLDIVADEAALG